MHIPLHTPRSTLHTPHATLHAPRSTLHTPHATLHTPHIHMQDAPLQMGVVVSYLAFGPKVGGSVRDPNLGGPFGAHTRAWMTRKTAEFGGQSHLVMSSSDRLLFRMIVTYNHLIDFDFTFDDIFELGDAS